MVTEKALWIETNTVCISFDPPFPSGSTKMSFHRAERKTPIPSSRLILKKEPQKILR